MVKTLVELEASDIKWTKDEDPDPIHSFLAAEIIIIGLTISGGGIKPKEGEDVTDPIKRLVAGFLNRAWRSGIAIEKVEEAED